MEGTRLINLMMRASEVSGKSTQQQHQQQQIEGMADAKNKQFLWILLVLALVGNMLSIQSGPSVINYDMFTAVFAMLSLLYLIPATITDRIAFHWAFPFTLDLLNVLFIFCAAVATPGYLGVPNCSDYVSRTLKVIHILAPLTDTPIRTASSSTSCLSAQLSAAVKRKPRLPFSGSPGLRSWYHWCSQPCKAVVDLPKSLAHVAARL